MGDESGRCEPDKYPEAYAKVVYVFPWIQSVLGNMQWTEGAVAAAHDSKCNRIVY